MLREEFARHQRGTIDESIVRAAVDRAASLDGVFPAKAIALLDAAVTRATLGGATTTELVHVYSAGGGFVEREEV